MIPRPEGPGKPLEKGLATRTSWLDRPGAAASRDLPITLFAVRRTGGLADGWLPACGFRGRRVGLAGEWCYSGGAWIRLRLWVCDWPPVSTQVTETVLPGRKSDRAWVSVSGELTGRPFTAVMTSPAVMPT